MLFFLGHNGSECAVYASAHFLECLVSASSSGSSDDTLLFDAFTKIDERITSLCLSENYKSGTTASCVYLKESKIAYLAWCGDSSIAVLKANRIETLSSPHKPENPEELKRIEEAGGVVLSVQGVPRLNGVLNLSRSLGDIHARPMVSSKPDISKYNISEVDYMLFLATDGIWESLEEGEIFDAVCLFVTNHQIEEFHLLAEFIANKAKESDSIDNLTLICISLVPLEEIWYSFTSYHCYVILNFLYYSNLYVSEDHILRIMRTLMSGVQPTGAMHIGNYLGFLKRFVKLQECKEYDRRIIKIADLHSVSTGFLPKNELKNNICQTLAILLSTGVDPCKTLVVQQSRVPELTELMWILGSVTTLPMLTRLSQFKDKSKLTKTVPFGLVSYPLLQAADVLGYHSTDVLVGYDQVQNFEFLKDVARSFNLKVHREYFSIPNQVHTSSPKIKSLCNPAVKMSKSDPKKKSCINLLDSKETIIWKIKSALSDTKPEITFNPEERPAISNLVSLYGVFAGMSTDHVVQECQGLDTVTFKLRLASILDDHIQPIREKYHQWMDDKNTLWDMLESTGKEARHLVSKTLDDVKAIVGLSFKRLQALDVTYWLAKSNDESLGVELSHEHKDFRWVSLSDALELAQHEEMKKFLREADVYIAKNFAFLMGKQHRSSGRHGQGNGGAKRGGGGTGGGGSQSGKGGNQRRGGDTNKQTQASSDTPRPVLSAPSQTKQSLQKHDLSESESRGLSSLTTAQQLKQTTTFEQAQAEEQSCSMALSKLDQNVIQDEDSANDQHSTETLGFQTVLSPKKLKQKKKKDSLLKNFDSFSNRITKMMTNHKTELVGLEGTDENSDVSFAFVDELIDESLNYRDRLFKRDPQENKYNAIDLLEKAKEFKKNKEWLAASEFVWFSFSCSVCTFFGKIKYDLVSHSSTHVFVEFVIDSYTGNKWALRDARGSANSAHKACYRRIVLADIDKHISNVERFITEIDKVEKESVAKAVEEFIKNDRKVTSESWGTCEIYDNKHVDYVFGQIYDFEYCVDIPDSRKYKK
ncbi:hypothetical protein Mgra_00003605 [Meloidogyne graminicola]|uniref:tryptophan--tRNA ligase n=1 Tax=Meloidogyne graminicola TaxID=189291 RepID=A0A8S9ZU35_9BILA|nr:hypothetical protein Mgra_00003605 [Meloidogyne graminicola]